MLEKSEFTKKSLINEVKKNYGLTVRKIETIKRGSANIFKIKANHKLYILKEFQSDVQDDLIKKEINVINHLNNKKLIVPRFIKCLNGEYYFKHNNKVVVFYEYIKGSNKEKNKSGKKELLDSAKNLALLVNAMEDYPFDDMKKWDKNSYPTKKVLEKAIETNQKMIEKTKYDKTHGKEVQKDLEDKIRMLNIVISKDYYKNMENLTIKKTHGDYNILQLIYERNKIKAIIDFTTAGMYPITWEIIRSYSYMDKKCKQGKFDLSNLILYVKEYMKYSPLSLDDLKYMPHNYLIQILNSTYGYRQYIESGNLDMLKFGQERTNICRYLIDNIENISEKLLEINTEKENL